MNIHLILTDIWFYTTLLLLLGYIILGGFALYALRKVKPLLKLRAVKMTGNFSAPTSTLRARLQQNDRASN